MTTAAPVLSRSHGLAGYGTRNYEKDSTGQGDPTPGSPSDVHPASPTCAHHYRLPEPDGRHTLPGVWRKCGHEREFLVAGDDEWFTREARQGKGMNGGAM